MDAAAAAAAALKEAAAAVLRGGSGEAATNDGALQVVRLKREQRELFLATDAKRQNTGAAKQQVERTYKRLDNLLYEQNHYDTNIQACRAFRSAVTDAALELAPLDEYRREAPAHLQSGAPGDEHALMLNRLNFELLGAQPGARPPDSRCRRRRRGRWVCHLRTRSRVSAHRPLAP